MALTAATLVLSILVAGCLGGTTPTEPLTITLLTDTTVSAQAGWTVGWPVNVGQSIGDNQNASLAVSAPSGWNAYYLKPTIPLNTSGQNGTSFLLVDIPADAADGSYSVTVTATVGGRSVSTTGTVELSHPTTNILVNGSQVSMDYVGFLDTNEVFDTSMWSVADHSLDMYPDFANSSATRHEADYHPLSLTLGSGQVIKGWDLGLLNMSLGEGKALIIPPDLAYGRFYDQVVNLTEARGIYNTTPVSDFTIAYGEAPAVDTEYKDPTFGWTVRVVAVDNVTGMATVENMPATNHTYTPYGVNATVSNMDSAKGTFEVHYAPVDGQDTLSVLDTGVVTEVTAGNFTMHWQTEHRQSLAPYSLYFLVFVRTAS